MIRKYLTHCHWILKCACLPEIRLQIKRWNYCKQAAFDQSRRLSESQGLSKSKKRCCIVLLKPNQQRGAIWILYSDKFLISLLSSDRKSPATCCCLSDKVYFHFYGSSGCPFNVTNLCVNPLLLNQSIKTKYGVTCCLLKDITSILCLCCCRKKLKNLNQ